MTNKQQEGAGGGVVLPRAKITEEAMNRAPLIPGVTTNIKKESSSEGMRGKKELIPVVSHVITDDQVGGLPGVKMQPVNMNKTIKLLTDPHSAMLYDRHVNALRKIVKHYRQGFLMKDLVQVFKILSVCADRVEEQPCYEEPMSDILKLCTLPFLCERASDESSYEQISTEAVSQLGYLMRVPSSEVRVQICRSIRGFYDGKPAWGEVQHFKPASPKYNRSVVEQSDVSETLVKSLALLEAEIEVLMEVLEVLMHLSTDSAKNCKRMLDANAAYRICLRINDPEPMGSNGVPLRTKGIFFMSIEILWNLLEYGGVQIVAEQLSNVECITQLKEAFGHQLVQGFSHYDRQLRNDLLVLSTLVAKGSPKAPFVETGFAKQLVTFATFQEVKSQSALVRHLKLGTNIEDFELKKLLIHVLVVLSQNHAMLPILSDGNVLLALFSFIEVGAEKSKKTKKDPHTWSAAQFEELQLQAIASLQTLAPLCLGDYMALHGNTRLLLLFDWCVSDEAYFGHGNSFHGQGGRGGKKAHTRHLLQLMRNMVGMKPTMPTGTATREDVSKMIQDLIDQGAIQQFVSTLSRYAAVSGTGPGDEIDVGIQSDMLHILATLCKEDVHRKEIFGGSGGVEMLVKFLTSATSDPTSFLATALCQHRLLLALLDGVWSCVVGSDVNEGVFLEMEGVFLLVDLLQVAPAKLRASILGALLDLSETPSAIPHLTAWRGDDGIPLAKLLCRVWREEEAAIGVKRDEKGAISDPSAPLAGNIQRNAVVQPQTPATAPSLAVVDVAENQRAKIYAIFCKIGFHVAVGHPKMSVEDHVTMTIIDHYLDFKMAEVWTEVQGELSAEGVKPIKSEREAFDVIDAGIKERVHEVRDAIQGLIEENSRMEEGAEQDHYRWIHDNHRQLESSKKKFNEFIERTSKHQTLTASKRQQEELVTQSRIKEPYRERDGFHDTTIKRLNVTAFAGRHAFVDPCRVALPRIPGRVEQKELA